jgi:hypothetical protein
MLNDFQESAPTDFPAAITPSATKCDTPQEGGSEAVQLEDETHEGFDRFSSPLIQEIVEVWRARQDMVRAQQKLTLQAKAICRRFTAGDKIEAEKLYQAIINDRDHPMAMQAGAAIMPLRAASRPVEDQRKAYERHLTKLGAQLPISHMADEIKGIGHLALAKIVGECGDLSAYEKGITGIWKRMGVAVINGERQRKKSGDEALLHGYAPERRSVLWNIGDALLKAQGKGETAGKYRRIYDAVKERERPRVETDGHAHNRAKREMEKALLEDLWREWCAVTNPGLIAGAEGHISIDHQSRCALGSFNEGGKNA